MKAILIDVSNKTVTDIEIDDKGNMLNQYYELIGGKCRLVQIATYLDESDESDFIFVDEEGLVNGTEFLFHFKGAHQPFAGNGIVLGSNEEGDTVSPKITALDVSSKVTFMTGRDAYLWCIEQEKEERAALAELLLDKDFEQRNGRGKRG